jgi:hypothetical protein
MHLCRSCVCAFDFDYTLRVESRDGVFRNLGAPEGDDVVQKCLVRTTVPA